MTKEKTVFEGANPLAQLVYIAGMSAALMYVLCKPYAFWWSLLMTAFTFGVYMVFYVLRKKKLFSFLAFTGFCIFTAIVMAIAGAFRNFSFLRFVFTSSSYYEPLYAFASVVLFGSIIGFAVCYFSAILPRPGFLLLPAFIPLIFVARTTSGLPIGLLAFLVVGYILAAAFVAKQTAPDKHTYFDDRSAAKQRAAAFLIFAAAAALLLIVIPINTNTPKGQYFDDLLKNQTAPLYGRQSLSNFEERSAPNTGMNRPSKNVLFYASTNSPKYVSRWSFDTYKGEDGWVNHKDYSLGYSGNWKKDRTLDPNTLISKLKKGAAEGKLKEYSDLLNSIRNVQGYSDSDNMTIRVVDGSNTSVVIHPAGTYDVNITGFSGNIYKNGRDEIWTKEPFGVNPTYSIEYFTDVPNSGFVKLIESRDFGQLLDNAVEEEVIDAVTADAFKADYVYAESYYRDTLDDQVTDELKAVADSITAGLTTDLEKALAIEKWFGEQDFIYDLDFVPERPTNDFFMFESRRGICTDFATASTLLLRAAGIPARYTEGFMLKETSRDEYGRYEVTAENAHAYSTAYIRGYGWLEIDGTRYVAANGSAAVKNVLIALLIAAAVILVLAIVFRKQISELWFRLRFAASDKKGKIRLVYFRTRKLASGILDANPDTVVSDEVLGAVSRTLGTHAEAAEITAAANELFYGGETPSVAPQKLMDDYRIIYKAKKARK